MTPPTPKHIAILGSTGSIGQQTLQVIKSNKQLYRVAVLTAQNNADLLISQALEHKPHAVVIGNSEHYLKVKSALRSLPIDIHSGAEAIREIVDLSIVDKVITAMVGISGLDPTIRAIKSKKEVLLANKETLAVAGQIITEMASENNVPILPLDSEHSAIFQCLMGEMQNPIEKIFLTASGGPFRGMSADQLAKVSKKEALDHPNWSMGDKISIDSATMMNKGLEMLEAKWLFKLAPGQIEIIIHPQSVIHSMVQFEDGSIKAQMGVPDMKQPILFALGYPKRIPTNWKRFCFSNYPVLEFEQISMDQFPCLRMANLAFLQGGNIPCVMNAANEIAVSAFLREEITFLQIHQVIEHCLASTTFQEINNVDDIIAYDREARVKAEFFVKTIHR
ncbi:MAG: 1-deoxy-D-xylulose-5-phosphate reductoisomerase [Bacteroidia bacterium]|nr:MAG: 1-deoxy-D-xylulose-5-phosphate reductoisomerase [Bacteroidia bacterium]